MLVLGQVSVINDLIRTNQFKNKWLLSGKRSNNKKYNKSVVKTVTMGKINQKHIFELFCRIQTPLRTQSLNQLEPKEWWCWPFLNSINYNLDSVKLCTNSVLNSPLLKSLHEYVCTLSLKLVLFCSSERNSLGERSPAFSVLAASNKYFLLPTLHLVVPFADTQQEANPIFQ